MASASRRLFFKRFFCRLLNKRRAFHLETGGRFLGTRRFFMPQQAIEITRIKRAVSKRKPASGTSRFSFTLWLNPAKIGLTA